MFLPRTTVNTVVYISLTHCGLTRPLNFRHSAINVQQCCSVFKVCSQHVNWSSRTVGYNKSTQLHDAFIGHARRPHDLISLEPLNTIKFDKKKLISCQSQSFFARFDWFLPANKVRKETDDSTPLFLKLRPYGAIQIRLLTDEAENQIHFVWREFCHDSSGGLSWTTILHQPCPLWPTVARERFFFIGWADSTGR